MDSSGVDPSVVRSLFLKALDLSPSERASVLDAPEISSEIRDEVRALLAADAGAETFLHETVDGERRLDGGLGERFGAFETTELLGRGGMGTVFKAVRIDGEMDQTVAVKVVERAWLDPRALERFRQERQFLAGLVHPNIARLLDGGTRADGVAYVILEYVDGLPLDRYCDRNNLSLSNRLRLFLPLCDAVDYAHQKLIIHRDLKPSNVLVNNAGEPKLLDFGIAKALDVTAIASTQTLVLTPEFASPEQARGDEVTTATDVYGLGAVLYFLLTGKAPHATAGRSAAEIQRSICEPPERPSIACPALKGDVENILLKALHAEPARRYHSARELKEDIENWLDRRPVRATPDSWAYRVRRFVIRHKIGVAATAVTIAALIAGLAVALWQAQIATREARTASAVSHFLRDVFRANSGEQADSLKARDRTARQLLDIGAGKIDQALNDAPTAKFTVLDTLARMYLELGLDDEAVKLYRKRVALAKATFGQVSAETELALSELAGAMHASGASQEEQGVLLEAKDVMDRRRDFQSLERALLLDKLAALYRDSDSAKALDYAHQSAAIYRTHLNSNPIESNAGLAESLYEIGVLLIHRGEFDQAIPPLHEAIGFSRGSKQNRYQLARLYAYLGQAHESLAQFGEAEESYTLAFREACEVNGQEHVDAVQTGMRLGSFLVNIGRQTQGLAYLDKALETVIKIRGDSDTFHTPQVLMHLGTSRAKNGQIEEASNLLSRANALWRPQHPGSPFLAVILESHADVSIELGRYQDAQNMLDEAEVIDRKTADTRRNTAIRARLLDALGKPDEAAKLIAAEYGASHESSVLTLKYLNEAIARQNVALMSGDAVGAIRIASRIREQIAASPERQYLKLYEASAAFVEGRAFLLQQAPDRALPLLSRALELRSEVLNPLAPSIGEVQVALAECYFRTGDRQHGAAALGRAQTIFRAHKQLGQQYTRPLIEAGKLAKP